MNRSTSAVILVASLLAISPAAGAADTRAREEVKRALAQLVEKAPLASGRVGVEVRSLDDGTVVFARNADELMNPASNTKLFTAAAALVKLGPDYRYETEFLSEPDAAEGKIKILYVRGKGDPTITSEKLYGIVTELVHTGLREVGDIVVDDTWFDGERFAPGYDQERSDRSYMAPSGAVSLNWNTVGVYVRSGAKPGEKADVGVEPASDFFIIDNTLTTGRRRYRRFSVASEPAGENQKITLRGVLPAEPGGFAVWKKIDNPPAYFGQTLKAFLQARGIKVRGKVRLERTAPDAKLVHVSQSETLDLVLKRLNKSSSNFVAEQLIKTLGAELKAHPGSHAAGISVVEEFLEREVGLARGSYVMKNGSGLNDSNRFSAAQHNKLLHYMWERFPLAPEYLSSLGIAGKDGTLRYRFEGSDAVGRLRAKTGTLDMGKVSALSGYVQAVDGEKFTFSIMVNDYTGRVGPVVQGIDALGAAIAAAGSKGGPGTAIAAALSPLTEVAPLDEAATRIKTYLAVGKQADQRNIPFLRTAWRSEKDPAVRAVVAESIFRSNPQDYLGVRTLLDSVSASDEVYGRLRKVARELKMDVPAVSAVIEVAAEGNVEALAKLVELSRGALSEPESHKEMAAVFAEVARTAPEELLVAMQSAADAERSASTQLLASGLVEAADPKHVFWPALRKAMGSVDPAAAAFAKAIDGELSRQIAAANAPPIDPAAAAAAAAAATPTVKPPATSTSAELRPGG